MSRMLCDVMIFNIIIIHEKIYNNYNYVNNL